MRRASTCLAVLGLAVLGLRQPRRGARRSRFKAKAVPIPGFPHTGNILGAGAALKLEYTITGTEYDGLPAAADRGQRSSCRLARSCTRRGSRPARRRC